MHGMGEKELIPQREFLGLGVVRLVFGFGPGLLDAEDQQRRGLAHEGQAAQQDEEHEPAGCDEKTHERFAGGVRGRWCGWDGHTEKRRR